MSICLQSWSSIGEGAGEERAIQVMQGVTEFLNLAYSRRAKVNRQELYNENMKHKVEIKEKIKKVFREGRQAAICFFKKHKIDG